jgi:hypothetical protein
VTHAALDDVRGRELALYIDTRSASAVISTTTLRPAKVAGMVDEEEPQTIEPHWHRRTVVFCASCQLLDLGLAEAQGQSSFRVSELRSTDSSEDRKTRCCRAVAVSSPLQRILRPRRATPGAFVEECHEIR